MRDRINEGKLQTGVLEQGLHHVLHLEKQRRNLLVVVPALQIELDDDPERSNGDCEVIRKYSE